MNRSVLYRASLVTLLALVGCSERGDSLTREKASMEAEAKAMAAHDSKPRPGGERQPPLVTDPLMSKAPASGGGAKLPAGTIIHVAATQSLSTRSAIIGQDWSGRLAEDIRDGKGNLLAKAGSDTKGRVVLVSDGSQLRRKHELELRVYRIQTARGSSLDVRTTTIIVEGAERGTRPAIVETGAKLDFQLSSETTFPE
jgi:hypothetical protein